MSWNEADHPRVPAGHPKGGQFSSKAGSGWESLVAKTAREAAGLDPEIEQKIDYWVRDFRGQVYASSPSGEWPEDEQANIYSEDGNLVVMKRGKGPAVTFTKEEAEKIKGGVMFHNHPTNGFLSSDDLAFTVSTGLKDMIAVTEEGYHRAEAKYYYENNSVRKSIAVEVHQAWSRLNDKIYDEIYPRVISGELNQEEAQDFHQEEMTKRLPELEAIKPVFNFSFTPWERSR